MAEIEAIVDIIDDVSELDLKQSDKKKKKKHKKKKS